MDSSKDDGGELGRLMHDFRAKEAKEMQAGALADRVHELKETEKGVEHMCKEMGANSSLKAFCFCFWLRVKIERGEKS